MARVRLNRSTSQSLLDHQPLADFAEHTSLEVPLLVAAQLLRRTKTAEHFTDQAFSSGSSALVRHRVPLQPLREVVYGQENIAVPLVGGRKRAPNIHSQLHRHPHSILLQWGMGAQSSPSWSCRCCTGGRAAPCPVNSLANRTGTSVLVMPK